MKNVSYSLWQGDYKETQHQTVEADIYIKIICRIMNENYDGWLWFVRIRHIRPHAVRQNWLSHTDYAHANVTRSLTLTFKASTRLISWVTLKQVKTQLDSPAIAFGRHFRNIFEKYVDKCVNELAQLYFFHEIRDLNVKS